MITCVCLILIIIRLNSNNYWILIIILSQLCKCDNGIIQYLLQLKLYDVQ